MNKEAGVPRVASTQPQQEPDGPARWQRELHARELRKILGEQGAAEAPETKRAIWGLALSGGGIRSATFSLGVIQALAKERWLGGFHYLSTVSGGGYIGAFLQGLIVRNHYSVTKASRELGVADDTDGNAAGRGRSRQEAFTTGPAIRQLRCYSNFLAPDKAAFSSDRVTFASVYAGNLLITQVQLAAWLLLLMSAPLFFYVAIEFLSAEPWRAAIAGMASAVLAMSLRGWTQWRLLDCRDAYSRATRLERAMPALLLSISVVCMTALLLGDTTCLRMSKCPGTAVGAGRLARVEHFIFRPGVAMAIYLAGFFTWLAWWKALQSRIAKQKRERSGSPTIGAPTLGSRVARHIVGCAGAVVLLGVAMDQLFLLRTAPWQWAFGGRFAHDSAHAWWILLAGVPLVFVLVFFVSAVHLGVAFYTAEDRLSRERWTRIIGRCGVFVLLLVTAGLFVTIGPWAVNKLALPGNGWSLSALSVLSSALGARLAYFDRGDGKEGNGRWMRMAKGALIALAPAALVAGILLFNAMLAQEILLKAGPTAALLSDHLTDLDKKLSPGNWPGMVVGLAVIALIGAAFSYFIDDNESSMNGFYRNRLVRSYLAPSNKRRRGDPETDQDPVGDDILLSRLLPEHGERPLYPLVSAAANLTASPGLDWQDRRAASFVFSPLFCGHLPPGKRPQSRPIGDRPPGLPLLATGDKPLAQCMTLGTAVSISGAAVSPNMGYHSSGPVAFLLTLFNARLGWWVENQNVKAGPGRFLGAKLLSELLSRSRDTARFTYVSDGGHFENLGIYELVRRQCRFILSVDASADADRDFESLGNAIHKCRVDFGASIDIDVSLMRPNDRGISKRGAAIGKIKYADGSSGVLLYIKPSLVGNETADIARYSSANPEFPHQPTHDQFFDEHQFEAYRQLGFTMASRLLTLGGEPWELMRSTNEKPMEPLTLSADPAKEDLLMQLEHWLYEPSDAISLKFTTQGAALCRLLERQRNSPILHCLDDQLTPGWVHAGGKPYTLGKSPSHLRLPTQKAFRSCFYFIQEVIQLMEAVYMELDLERNYHHPDNRGWMNLFRQWAWIPMFRLVWALTSQTLGSRFARFCERMLGAPQVSRALCMHWSVTTDVRNDAEKLHAAGQITFIEKELLQSAHVVGECAARQRMELGMLRINWDDIFGNPEAAGPLKDFNLGIVVAVSAVERGGVDTLIVGRVQDHLRRMGLGAEMIFHALEEHQGIKHVRIEATEYGPTIGCLDAEDARRQAEELHRMLVRARLRRQLSVADLVL